MAMRLQNKASMKVPPKRKGNLDDLVLVITVTLIASMKVPPKRKANTTTDKANIQNMASLNESPSEKEGK